jgi:adenosine kinase
MSDESLEPIYTIELLHERIVWRSFYFSNSLDFLKDLFILCRNFFTASLFTFILTIMSILISGSIAFDTIIQTVWDFRSQDTNPSSDLTLSLFAPQVRREYGGTAGNIAYSLALLGSTPHVIASVGADARDTIVRMQEMGIHTELIQTLPDSLSAQAYIIRDGANGQINTFHPGAMSTSGEITHGGIDFDYAIVSPDSKEGMMRRVRECKASGIYTIFDPWQAMGIFGADELREMTELADITIMNEPERAQYLSIVGVDFVEICLKSDHLGIETLGERWATIISQSSKILILALEVEKVVDATGCGDAWRAGLLYGLNIGWDIEKSAQLGSILGGTKISSMGGQNHSLDKSEIDTIGKQLFGHKFFA